MRTKLSLFAIIASLLFLVSCEREPVYNTYENPHWAVTSYEGLSETCTIVMQLPENLLPYQSEDALCDSNSRYLQIDLLILSY